MFPVVLRGRPSVRTFSEQEVNARQTPETIGWPGPGSDRATLHCSKTTDYAPNLSSILALACMYRMRYLASNKPSEPRFAPVSVKRSSLSEPLYGE